MPKYLALVKYSPAGLAGARRDGYGRRYEVLAGAAASLGGNLDAMWFTEGGEYDFAAVLDVEPDVMYTLTQIATATGTASHTKVITLRTATEADATMAHQYDWTPPGQAT
jgi:uncharacterized protein with GYD domain